MYRGERMNSITHLVGTVLSLVGAVVLIVLAGQQGDPWKIVSFSIYGATLVLLYFFSTLYHSVRGAAKQVFQKIDHSAIYLLIAGTYTPFTLVTLRGPWGWSLFSIVWALAVIGIIQDLLHTNGRRSLSVVIYLLMGWLALVAIRPLMDALPEAGIAWLVAGGVSYTVGVLFFALHERIPYGHEIFHLFVLAGSACHYLMILRYIA
jgi:hemolysin III